MLGFAIQSKFLLPYLESEIFNNAKCLYKASQFTKNIFNNGNNILMVPDANIIETKDSFIIELAAPGLQSKDFKIKIQNNVLTISVKTTDESINNIHKYSKEFSYNSFYRSFNLPQNSLIYKIETKYNIGVLQLILPKRTVSKPVKEINIS